MHARLIAKRTSWSFANQGIVSLSNFLLNIQFARGLVSADYGVIALLLGAMLAMMVVNYSLLNYPLSVRIHQCEPEDLPEVLGSIASLSACLALLLGGILALVLLLFDRGDLLPAAVLCYLAWESHQTLRRFLFANFRYRSAVIGDITAYGGNLLSVAILSATGILRLDTALYAMTAGFIAGAAVHAAHLTFRRSTWNATIKRAREFLALGAWSLATQETHALRVQLVPWAIAISVGSAAVAVYQAALNIANLTNPILMGMANVMPQAVAQARISNGVTGAWTVARKYILLGLVCLIICSAPAILWPDFLLQVLYGADSPYRDEALTLQILVLAWVIHLAGELIVLTLLGMEAGRSAMAVNLGALAAAAIVTIPLVVTFGVFGACLALLIANLVRLPIAWLALTSLMMAERSRQMKSFEGTVS